MKITRLAAILVALLIAAVASLAFAQNYCAQSASCPAGLGCNLTSHSCTNQCNPTFDGGGWVQLPDAGYSGTQLFSGPGGCNGYCDGGAPYPDAGVPSAGLCISAPTSGRGQYCSGPGTCGQFLACVSNVCVCGGYQQPCCYGTMGCNAFPDGGLGSSGYGMICGGATCSQTGNFQLCCGGGQ